MFLEAFNEVTLAEHGFNGVINSQEVPLHHLRGRKQIPYAINDIYDIGLSIFEKEIVTGLHKSILKYASITPQKNSQGFQSTINEDNALLIEKINVLSQKVDSITEENRALKNHVNALERKLNSHITRCQQQQQQVQENRPHLDPPDVTHPPPEAPQPQVSFNTPNTSNSSLPKAPSQTTSNSSRAPTFGKRTTAIPGIIGNRKLFSLFVGGFNLDLSTQDAKELIHQEIGLEVLDISQIKRNSHNQSFRVDIASSSRELALDPNSWFEGLIVKPYRPANSKPYLNYHTTNQNRYQQHHSRDSHRYQDRPQKNH
eukprot:TCONS_00034328-protein